MAEIRNTKFLLEELEGRCPLKHIGINRKLLLK
jgi:hypothetical protein